MNLDINANISNKYCDWGTVNTGVFVISDSEESILEKTEQAVFKSAEISTCSFDKHKIFLPVQTLEENIIDIENNAHRFFFKENEKDIVEKIYKLINQDVHDYMTTDEVKGAEYKIYENGLYVIVNEGCVRDVIKKNLDFIYDANEDLVRNRIKQNINFICHANRIIEFKEVGWIMKGGEHKYCILAYKTSPICAPKYDNIMRVFMAEKLTKVIQEENLDIEIPQKRLLPSLLGKNSDSLYEKYYVFAKKVELLDPIETKNKLKEMELTDNIKLRKITSDICTLIKKTGFLDPHLNNLRWDPKLKKITIIDTETLGILIKKSEITDTDLTLQKCIVQGLYKFRDSIKEIPTCVEVVDKALSEIEYLKPE